MKLEVDFRKDFGEFCLEPRFTVEGPPAAILGASGCGKSMTLKCIAGVVRPDEGKIVLDGKTLFDSEKGIDLPPQKRQVGLLFQNYALFPNMTLEQNVMCGLTAEKDRAKRRAKCDSMLEKLGLSSLKKHRPSQLSGGQQQRAALARILVSDPKLLMLDEPFSALDSFLREGVENEVAAILGEFGGVTLIVTHNRDEAYRLCDGLIVMENGRVLRQGATREVFANPQSVQAARLTGCKNILPCKKVGEDMVLLEGWNKPLRLAVNVPDNCTAVGIRAHDFYPCEPQDENALPVQGCTYSENPFDWNVACTAPDGHAVLWWKVSKTTLDQAKPGAPQYLAAPPEKIMPLF